MIDHQMILILMIQINDVNNTDPEQNNENDTIFQKVNKRNFSISENISFFFEKIHVVKS